MRLIRGAAVACLAAAALLPVQGQSQSSFVFKKPDLKLLEECEALDQQFEKRALVYHDAALEKRLTDLATPLLPAVPLEHVQWRFRILRDPMVNAFALANGSVYVNTGLLARAENDDQVAGVLAHEVVHVTNRHPYIFNRSQRKKVVVSEVVAITAEWIPLGGWGASVMIAADLGQLAIVQSIYGYSRQLEGEADQAGAEHMKAAGRDPAQLQRMLEILDDKLEPEPVPYLFFDHPRTKDRIADLKKLTGAERKTAVRDDVGYMAVVRPAILQNIQLDLDSRRFRSAVAAAQRLVSAYPEDPAALYWLGESYRALGPRQPRLTAQESTDQGLRKGFRQTVKRTEEEQAEALADTPEGRAALEANRRKAEELFRKAAAIAGALADPYFGLGSLYEEEGKDGQAVEAYRMYVERAALSAAKDRAERRIAGIIKRAKGDAK